MSVNNAVRHLNTALHHMRSAKRAETQAQASEKKAATTEQAARANVATQEKQILDQFQSGTLDPSQQKAALDKLFGLGVKDQQAQDAYHKAITSARSTIAHEKKAFRAARHQALRDLKPAEYHLSLKQTNADRKELGLKPLQHALRPTASQGAQRILNVARQHLGYHEGPGNSNPFSHDMGRPSEAWCADFVSYCVKHAGLHTVNTASAQGIAQQLQAEGRWKGHHNPQPGDAVTFNWSGSHGWADHVGIVEKVFKKGGQTYIQTIEGNASDSVRRNVYPVNSQYINGFGRLA